MCSTEGNEDPLFPIVSRYVALQFCKVCGAEFLMRSAGILGGRGNLDEGDVGRVLATCGEVELWAEVFAVGYCGLLGHVVDKVEFRSSNISGCFQVVACIGRDDPVYSVGFNSTNEESKSDESCPHVCPCWGFHWSESWMMNDLPDPHDLIDLTA
jgi:hypothetical protein